MTTSLISDRFADNGKIHIEVSEIQEKYIEIFKEKCSRGEYSFRERECECDHGDLEIIARRDRYGISVDTVICRNCGLIMSDPCLDDKSNNEFYDNEYPYIYRAEEKPADQNFTKRMNEAKDIVAFIRRHTGITKGTVLEIGCADGGNVAQFQNSGYTACGIDLSHTYVEYGKSKGLDLYCCDASSFEKKDQKYDIVVLNHVLEHFTDPGRELRVIRNLLTEQGCLFISVPGVKYLTFGAYQADFLLMLQNAHIFNFTKRSLRNVMRKYGFESIYCNEAVWGVFKKGEPDAHYENVYEDTVQYLEKVEAAHGNIKDLMIGRVRDILSSYNSKEVVLYGSMIELDELVSHLNDLNMIKGFFYSDNKTPEEVIRYVMSDPFVKSVMLVDLNLNKYLTDSLLDPLTSSGIRLYSLFNETF